MAIEVAVELPHGWDPRKYQRRAWRYLQDGGKRAALAWHRRAGKDDVCLHHAACEGHKRIGTYWHMLPEANQARKAIWEAVNPHTGKRRIDEAFPHALRAATRENEMFIRFKSGSSWQVVGSDNFNSLVGAPPVGVVFSEYPLANPASWAYLRPILAENNGWAIFIGTPRGRNHFATLMETAERDPHWFAERLTADQTGVFTPETLARERAELIREHGEDAGEALYQQEYFCSFDAAILGAIYGRWMAKADAQGRIGLVLPEPGVPVHTAWDLGYDDQTAIWWWQLLRGEIRLLSYYEASGQLIGHYCEKLKERAEQLGITYGKHYVPHDAAHKLLAAGGRSIVEQAYSDHGVKMHVVGSTTHQNAIAAARKTLERCWFDRDGCELGIAALRQYRFDWDDAKKIFKSTPRHDWASHGGDAFEIIGQVWRTPYEEPAPAEPKFLHNVTANEVFWPDDLERSQERI